jgi:hypothetical protein
VRTYGRAVSGKPTNGAGEDYAPVPEGIAVMGIVNPAEHIGECIVAVHLGIALIMLGEEISVRQGNGMEV